MSGPLIDSPSKVIWPFILAPGIRSFIRLKQRSRVLLPQPEGPIRAVILFRGMEIVMSFRASDVPYQTFEGFSRQHDGVGAGQLRRRAGVCRRRRGLRRSRGRRCRPWSRGGSDSFALNLGRSGRTGSG